MEQNTKQQEPVISNTEMKMPEESFGATHEASDPTTYLGVILGILIVLLILILGGLYIWGTTLHTQKVQDVDIYTRPTPEVNNEPESTNAEAQVETLGALSNSTDIDTIQADIDSTNLDQLDAELNAIDTELDTTLNTQ